MTTEDEIKDLREKNNELVQKVQYWKMTAAQRENEKLNLMKEINELRLKLSRLRSNGGVQARNLDAALQTASEKALAHLVRASGEIARTMDLAKAYMRDREELDAASPRWSAISGTPTTDKSERVHRVPPMMMGGQSIQPVVALSRTLLNTSNPRSASRSPSQNRNVTERAVPMYMLQDVYIPLTRIDAADIQTNNIEAQPEANNSDDSTADLGLDGSVERVVDESQSMSVDEDFESSRRLDAVTEEMEPENAVETPPRSSMDNPLEGPSWLLDRPADTTPKVSKSRVNLEPDSTTELEEAAQSTPPLDLNQTHDDSEKMAPLSVVVSCEFSPTVRRRKRTGSPPPPPPPASRARRPPSPAARRRTSGNGGRVLKVLVAKMRLEGEESGDGDSSPAKRPRDPSPCPCASPAPPPTPGSPGPGGSREPSPPKRPPRFDAPSPNGATDAGVIVLEAKRNKSQNNGAGDPVTLFRSTSRQRHDSHDSCDRQRHDSCDRQRHDSCDRQRHDSCDRQRHDSCDRQRNDSRNSRDSDSGSGGEMICQGRTRRPRKAVTYKEKPLNRKLRR